MLGANNVQIDYICIYPHILTFVCLGIIRPEIAGLMSLKNRFSFTQKTRLDRYSIRFHLRSVNSSTPLMISMAKISQ